MSDITKLQEEIDELRARLEQDAKDAARYRWLRDKAERQGYDGGWTGDYVFPHVPGWDDTPYSAQRGEGFNHGTLDSAIDAAQGGEMSEWIDIKTQLPPEMEGVLVYADGVVTAARFYMGNDGYQCWLGHGFSGYEWEFDFADSEVTHWQPLPSAPHPA